MPVARLFFIGVLAFACEYVDCAIGMGYGTILSPLMLILGFSPRLAVPTILLSQALGGLSAAVFHHRLRNVEFGLATRDSIVVYIITLFGIAAAVLSVFVAVNITARAVAIYIGALVLVMGILLLSGVKFRFRMRSMAVIAVISAFNKGISGGGFGPVVTGGQIISGQEHKSAIGITTLAEAPICITGFLTYLFMIGTEALDWRLMAAVSAGAVLATPLGCLTTSRLSPGKLKLIVGLAITILGVWTLIKILL